MAFDAFLQIDGIDGESKDAAHENWIEIAAYSFGVSMAGSGVGTTGRHSKGRADFAEFSISKPIDLASPTLAIACAKADNLGTVILSACRAGGDKLEFLNVELTDAILTSVQQSGSGELPTEDLSFGYSTITWTYTQQDETGAAVGEASAGWDLKKNEPLS